MELFLPLSGQKIKADLDGEAEEGEKIFSFPPFLIPLPIFKHLVSLNWRTDVFISIFSSTPSYEELFQNHLAAARQAIS